MSLFFSGKSVFPLKIRKIYFGDKLVYDRDFQKKSWFILDLETHRIKGD